ncbi:MAG: hybrid sensor histidine kinase/response regulator [Candidatus Acidiferrales bacterium]|jgi:two-component system sensor histidine kinase and response regulator WspE
MSNLGAFSMWDLFRSEVESQMGVLTSGLLALESGGSSKEHLASAMRAAHSIKGAARIVNLDVAVTLAHKMEDCLVAAQESILTLTPKAVDVLLDAGDLLSKVSAVEESDAPAWAEEHRSRVDELIQRLADVREGKVEAPAPPTPSPTPVSTQATTPTIVPPLPVTQSSSNVPAPSPETKGETPTLSRPATSQGATPAAKTPARAARSGDGSERAIKVAAQTFNRLMGLAGESLVQSRWFEPFSDSLLALKRKHTEIDHLLQSLQPFFEDGPVEAASTLAAARRKVQETRELVANRQAELDGFGLRSAGLSDRLYREVVASRMRPFGDGVQGFPRLVRDLARQLGKQVQIEILGTTTEVDREILERLETPLNHMIRNSLDHGIEPPGQRAAAGKPPMGTIRLEARHRAGLFVLTVSDDGRGVGIETLRSKVIEKGLATPEMAAHFSEAELLEFLFLPGFSTAEAVTDMSGRGVGLDAVQEMAKAVGGVVRISSRHGQGLSIQLELPLTLSVLRTFVAEIGGEPFAFPMTRIANVLKVNRSDLSTLEGQQYFSFDEERIGVVSALEVMEMPGTPNWGEEISVVLLGDVSNRYGLAVDRFVGEYDMAVRPLDARLGKVASISAVALMDDGSPVLIVDAEDLTRSVESLLHGGRLRGLGRSEAARVSRKRILVVDDSITVREVQRSLLQNRGYEVEVAVDGMDGWNALRGSHYDLTITDVDMPRMTGIELVSKIKADPNLHALPVIIVSYKDREEDRMRGLEAGADRYLTKSSFHDETLLSAVSELIGRSDR